MYYTYIVKCADSTLYAGITTDLGRRIDEHNNSDLGAKYTRTRRPVKLVYSQKFKTRSKACQREAEIKQMSRQEKLKLIKRG